MFRRRDWAGPCPKTVERHIANPFGRDVPPSFGQGPAQSLRQVINQLELELIDLYVLVSQRLSAQNYAGMDGESSAA